MFPTIIYKKIVNKARRATLSLLMHSHTKLLEYLKRNTRYLASQPNRGSKGDEKSSIYMSDPVLPPTYTKLSYHPDEEVVQHFPWSYHTAAMRGSISNHPRGIGINFNRTSGSYMSQCCPLHTQDF